MPLLNGINLGSDIYIENEYAVNRVISVLERTRGDAAVIWEDNAGPQPIDLVGGTNRGIIRKQEMDQLRQLANTPNQIFELVYNGESKMVRFRHWEEDVLSGEPLMGRENLSQDEVFTNIKIKLMEV